MAAPLVLLAFAAAGAYLFASGGSDETENANAATPPTGSPMIDPSKLSATLPGSLAKVGEYVVSGSHPELLELPSTEIALRLANLHNNLITPWRMVSGRLAITSGYRGAKLNSAIGGATGSQHTTGEAADVAPQPGLRAADIAEDLLELAAASRKTNGKKIVFDQLIAYHPSQGGHCHVSLRGPDRKSANRGQFFVKLHDGTPFQGKSYAETLAALRADVIAHP